MVAEFVHLMAFNVRTRFEFMLWDGMLWYVSTDVWISVAVLLYTFLMSAVHRGIRDVNDSVTSVRAWTARRTRWKELRLVSVRLTDTVFGTIIITFITFTMADITFFVYLVYHTYRNHYTAEMVAYILIIVARASMAMLLFRTCRKCKVEVLRFYASGVRFPNLVDVFVDDFVFTPV